MVSVKIPAPNNLDDLEDTVKSLKIVFGGFILDEKVEGDVKIKNFDTGSFWIDIAILSPIAVKIIADIATSSLKVYREHLKNKLLIEDLKKKTIETEIIETLKTQLENSENGVMEVEAGNIAVKYFEKNDNENKTKIGFAVKELFELNKKGAEIHPSIEAPQDVKDTFPEYNEIRLIESDVKQIENSSATDVGEADE